MSYYLGQLIRISCHYPEKGNIILYCLENICFIKVMYRRMSAATYVTTMYKSLHIWKKFLSNFNRIKRSILFLINLTPFLTLSFI